MLPFWLFFALVMAMMAMFTGADATLGALSTNHIGQVAGSAASAWCDPGLGSDVSRLAHRPRLRRLSAVTGLERPLPGHRVTYIDRLGERSPICWLTVPAYKGEPWRPLSGADSGGADV